MTISVKIVLEKKEAHTLAVPPPSGLKIITALAVEGPILNVNVNAARNISVTTVLENLARYVNSVMAPPVGVVIGVDQKDM